jgi:hypothetical protein
MKLRPRSVASRQVRPIVSSHLPRVRPNIVLEPTAAPLIRSIAAGVRTHVVRSTVSVGGCGLGSLGHHQKV